MKPVEPTSPADRRRRNLRRARIAVYLLVLLGLLWLGRRFDVQRLPEEGCSPLAELEPGDRLLLDRRPPSLAPGDVVVFRAGEDELLVARVAAPPVDLPPDSHWLESGTAACPGRASPELGPIPRDRIAARLVLVLW